MGSKYVPCIGFVGPFSSPKSLLFDFSIRLVACKVIYSFFDVVRRMIKVNRNRSKTRRKLESNFTFVIPSSDSISISSGGHNIMSF